MHQKSYDLHKQLASLLDIQSYREVITLNVDGNIKHHKHHHTTSSSSSSSKDSSRNDNVASWLDRNVISSEMDIITAQVTPKEFVDKLLASALDTQLVEVMIDTVVGVMMNDNNNNHNNDSTNNNENSRIVGVKTMNHGVIETDSMVICLGPWSGKICLDP